VLVVLAIGLLLVLPSPWGLAAFLVCLLAFPGEVVLWNRTVRNRREAVGAGTLIGTDAVVVTPCLPAGQVRAGGELWGARCVGGAATGDTVRIVGLDGLTLVVERVAAAAPPRHAGLSRG
jgi:membrane protein implicated in regulation of membrane protease activity